MEKLNIETIRNFIKSISVINWVKIGLVAIALIASIIYFSDKKELSNINSDDNKIVATTTTSKTTSSAPKVIPSKNVTSRCNFKVTFPTKYTGITMPLTVSGILDKADTSKGCIWNEVDSRAGDAEIFYNKNNAGWVSAGTAVPIVTRTLPGVATTTKTFSVSFNLYIQALGLSSGTPIKIVFTELNIPPQPNPDSFDFQVSLK